MDPYTLAGMNRHVDALFDCWAEFLRYRANRPYDRELRAAREAAVWFRSNGGRLWR